MDKSDDPRVDSQSNLDILSYVAAMIYDQEYGTHDDDKSKTIGVEEAEMDARIFGDKVPRKNRVHRSPSSREMYARIFGDKVPRKNRVHRSPSSREMVTPWTRVIEQQRSGPQNPKASEPEPSSSSCITQFKKRRLDDDQIIVEEIRSRKKLRIARSPLDAEPIQTSPPEWLLKVMGREENGYSPKLISTRKLYKTDLEKIQGRLSVPFKQVKNPDFLTEEETRITDEQAKKTRKEGVSVDLVDPQRKRHALELRKWKMSGNWYYVFVVGWNDVVDANRFKVDDFFPLWSFRSGRGKLCFAFVPPTDTSHGGDGASTSGECSNGCSSLDDL